MPSSISTFINERKEKTSYETAVLADEYVLMHKSTFADMLPGDGGHQSGKSNEASLESSFARGGCHTWNELDYFNSIVITAKTKDIERKIALKSKQNPDLVEGK